jgi:hypothetical protein
MKRFLPFLHVLAYLVLSADRAAGGCWETKTPQRVPGRVEISCNLVVTPSTRLIPVWMSLLWIPCRG